MSRGPLPQDPAVRALIQQARMAQLTRRGFITAGTASMALFLAACAGKVGGGGEGQPAASLTPGTDMSDTVKNMVWANWALYLDEDDDGTTPPSTRSSSAPGSRSSTT